MFRKTLLLLCVFPFALCARDAVVTQNGEVVNAPRSTATPSRLLFPFVSSMAGVDTEITLSNTSQDTLGSTPQAGTCTLNFYGAGAPVAGTTSSIAAGKQIVFNLSQGGGGIAAAPGFQGYIAASCGFPLARGRARISASGGPAFSQDAQVITAPRSATVPQSLLFPYFSAQTGMNTGIAIVNTSLDPFGTAPTSGTCTLRYYGPNAPAPFTTPGIPAGTMYANVASTLAPGFYGYVIATCNFSAAAGIANPSDLAGTSFSLSESPELLTIPRSTTASPLLFSSVTNQGGLDTALYIANTSSDALGTAPVSGGCFLRFYGINAPAGGTTGPIAAGSTYMTMISTVAPGFTGYVTANCQFPHFRGWTFRLPTSIGDGDTDTAELLDVSNVPATSTLLFSAVTNRNGANTAVTISNASQNSFGTSPAAGACTISYFGDMADGSNPPSPQTSSSIAAGSQLSFTLSQGNPVQGIAATPGFRGYVIADCGFPLARGLATITVPAPVLSITKSHSGNFLQGQANATYTVTVSNQAGAAPTSGTITVTETAPSGLTLTSMAGSGWSCPAVGTTCTRSDVLLPGASYEPITVTVNVAVGATSPQVNSVRVSGGGAASATVTDSTTITAAPAWGIVKTHSGNFTTGQTGATYTVTVSNLSTANATSGLVTVTENVPSGLTLVSMAGSAWSCPSLGNTCTRSDVLLPGASYPPITVTVNVSASAVSPQVNAVSVSGGGAATANTTDSTTLTSGVTIMTPGALGTWSISAHEQSLNALGCTSSCTWTLTAGALPPGMSLRSDFPGFFGAGPSGNLSGVVFTPGNYAFTLTATSGTQSASQAFTLRVTALRYKDGSWLPDAFLGVPYSYTFTALDNAGPVTWSATGLPAGLTLNPSTGELSGTPGATGSFTPVVTLNDGADTVVPSSGVGINVYAIRITSPETLPNATQYLPYSTTLTAAGGTSPYSFATSSGLPTGLTLNSNGTIAGTPTGGAGATSIRVTVTDSNQVSYSRYVTIPVVGAPERLMTITPYGYLDSCTVGMYCSLGFLPQNGGTPPFQYTATGLPAGMGIRSNSYPYMNPVDGELWGNPSVPGTYAVRVVLTDAGGRTATQTFPVTVSELGLWASWDGLPNGTRGTAYTKTMRVFGGVGPWSVTQVAGSLPAGLTLNGMTVSGTPGENGTFQPDFRFADSAGHVLNKTYSFTIANPAGSTLSINSGPTLGPYTQNVFLSTSLSACCAPTYTWTYVGGVLPPGLTLSADGKLSGTPSSAGTYTFLVQVADATNASNTGIRQMTVPITPVTITTGTTLPNGNVGTGYTQSLVASGGVSPYSWSLAAFNFLPPGLTLSTAGVLSGTPTASGFYVFSLIATATGNTWRSATFMVQIFPAGVNPPLQLNFGPTIGSSLVGNAAYQLTASGGVPPYHYSYTPAATPVPGMRVQDGPPLPTSFPSTVTGGFLGLVTAAGSYTSSIRVTDSAGTVFDRPIWWTVYDVVSLVQTALPKATAGTFYSFTLPGYGGSGNYSWSATGLPTGLTMSQTGTVSGTPATAGAYSPSFMITDLANNSGFSMTHTLIVNAYAITSDGNLPQGTVSAPYSKTLTAPGCGSGCTWSVSSGSLPGGLSLSSAGLLSGTPTGVYFSGFLGKVVGTNGTVEKEFTLQIKAATPQPLYISAGAVFGPTALNNLVASALTGVQGGTAPYTWTLTSGSLPPGIHLLEHGELLGANLLPGVSYLAGRVMQTGNYSFTLQVEDSATPTHTITTKSFTWMVPPLWISYTSLPITGTTLVYNQSQAYSQPILVYGGTGTYPSWTVVSGSLPPGLTLNPATGVVSGTPTNTGSFTAGVQVTDSAGKSTTQNVTLTVAGTGGVVVNAGSADSYVYQVGTTSISSLSPSGGTGPYTYAPAPSYQYPPGCSIEYGNTVLANTSSTYVFLCTPLAIGDFPFTFQVTDSLGNTGVRTSVLHVVPFTMYSSATLPNGSAGVPYSQDVLTMDNTTTVTWTLAAGSAFPPGLSMSGNTLTGTPTTAGNYSFNMLEGDGSPYTITYTFTLTVSTIHIDGPEILPHAISNTPYSYTFTAAGGGTKTWSATGLPSGIVLSPDGVLSGIASGSGFYRITVTATDGASTYTHVFTLVLRYATPAQPSFTIISTALGDVRVGATFSYSLSPSGGRPPYTWTVASGHTLPPGLRLLSGSSISQYSSSQTVGLTYIMGIPSTVGPYSFDLIATDTGGAQFRRTFTLNVTAMTILGGSLRNAVINTAYSQQLTAAGGTAPYTFTYKTSSLTTPMAPPGITLSPSGLISGTPTSTGSYSFIATAADSAGHSFTATYSWVSTNALGLYISTSPPSLGMGTGAQYAFAASGGSSTYTWSLLSGSLPPGMTFGPDGYLRGAPTAVGLSTFTLRATDDNNSANYADRVCESVRVDPFQVDTGRASAMPPGQVGLPYNYAFKITGGTPPHAVGLPRFYYLPPGLNLSSTGVLSGTPLVSGTFNFTMDVTDAAGIAGYASSLTLNILEAGQTNPITGSQVSYRAASVGVPYAAQLQSAILGGVPPISFALAPGESLPSGFAILPPSNGVPAYFGGIATTPGAYTFYLVATDAAGQTANARVSLNISPLVVSPRTVSHGLVGVPYSSTLTASGGTAPYTFQWTNYTQMPPGLTLSPSGVLSGIPENAGYYNINATLTDSAGTSLTLAYGITIDQNSHPQGIGLVPTDAIRLSYTRTAPAPTPLPVVLTTTSGSIPFNATVTGIPGASLSATTGTAPVTLSLNLATAGLVAGTYTGVVAVHAPQAGNGYTSVPISLTVLEPPPCNYNLLPSGGTTGAGGGPGSFDVAVDSLCSWTATASDPSWIKLTPGSGSGAGAGTVNYSVTPNTGLSARTGTITVGDQHYAITQFGSSCSVAIYPTSGSATAGGNTATVRVTTSDQACTWTASGLAATPPGGTGNGTVTFTILPTTEVTTQTLTGSVQLTAGGTPANFQITQSGVSCTVGLSAPGDGVSASGGSGQVDVTTPAGCSYNTVSGPGWIRVTSGGSGSGPGPVALTYSVDPNSTTVARTGTLGIGDKTYSITQDPTPCSVTVDASAAGSPFGSAGGSGVLAVTANGDNCTWTASSPVPWAKLAPVFGTGNDTIHVTVTSNEESTTSRTVNVTVAGQSVPVTQGGTVCSYSLGSTTAGIPYGGGTGGVTVGAPAVCGWTSTEDAGAPWLTISSTGNGGVADVVFAASANPNASPRSGTLTIAGQAYVVTQAAAPCLYGLAETRTTVASDGASHSFPFQTTAVGCSAQAVSYSGWLTVATNSSPDGASGTVSFTAERNPAGVKRTGTIQLAGQLYTVSQSGAACAYSLTSYGGAMGRTGGPGTVTGSQSALGCTPTPGTDQPGIVTLGSLTGPVNNIYTLPYGVAAFNSAVRAIRRMTITFGGQVYTVKQTSW